MEGEEKIKEMVEELLEASNLTAWETEFVSDIYGRLEQGQGLTVKQRVTVLTIWERRV